MSTEHHDDAHSMRAIVARINANENLHFLREVAGPVVLVADAATGVTRSVQLQQYAITIPSRMMHEFPLEFQNMVFAAMNSVAVQRSEAHFLMEQRQRLKQVPVETGKEFRYKKSMAGTLPHCTICLEEFKSNEKVRQLHTEQCSFHTRCLRRHLQYSSRCPNCNVDCGV